MGVLGACTTVTGGSAKVDRADAPAYRTSMSSSVAESAATSSMRESERQESLTTEAIHTACETLSTSSADAVDNVNAYVDAVNGEGDPVATEGAAADALNHSADLVAADVNDAVPQDIRDALSAWVRCRAGCRGSGQRTCAARSVQRRGRPVERQQIPRAGSLRCDLLNLLDGIEPSLCDD